MTGLGVVAVEAAVAVGVAGWCIRSGLRDSDPVQITAFAVWLFATLVGIGLAGQHPHWWLPVVINGVTAGWLGVGYLTRWWLPRWRAAGRFLDQVERELDARGLTRLGPVRRHLGGDLSVTVAMPRPKTPSDTDR